MTESATYYVNSLSDGSIAYSGGSSEVFKDGKKIIAANGTKFNSSSVTTILLKENEFITAHGWYLNY